MLRKIIHAPQNHCNARAHDDNDDGDDDNPVLYVCQLTSKQGKEKILDIDGDGEHLKILY